MHQQRDTQAMKSFLLFFFSSSLPVLSPPQPSFLFFTFLLTFLSTHSWIYHEILYYLIQTPCIYLGCSTLLRKSLITDHYPLFDYFQHFLSHTWCLPNLPSKLQPNTRQQHDSLVEEKMPGGHTIQRITMPLKIFLGVDNISLPTYLHQKRGKKRKEKKELPPPRAPSLFLLVLLASAELISSAQNNYKSQATYNPSRQIQPSHRMDLRPQPQPWQAGARHLTRPHQTVLDGPRFTVRPIFRIRRIVGLTLTINLTRRGIVNFCSPCSCLQHQVVGQLTQAEVP